MGLAWSNASGRRRRPEAFQVCNKKDDQSASAPGKRSQAILAKAVYARSKPFAPFEIENLNKNFQNFIFWSILTVFAEFWEF